MIKNHGWVRGLAGVGITVLMLAGTLVVNAQTSNSASSQQQTVVRIDQNGKALVRGILDSVSAGQVVVKSWGGNWIGTIGVGTQIMPALAGDDVTQFKPGDYVGIQGTVDQSANNTITATLVRDWTYQQVMTAERKQNASAARTASLLAPKNYVGAASGVSGQSFTLTIKGVANTVNVPDDAEIVNRNWISMPISSINNGDTVRVWGVNTSGTIAATIVRDTSLPATSTPATQ